MNEFTKDELVMLKRLALQHINLFRQNSDCIELFNKIQLMIDNYCEHEKTKQCNISGQVLCADCGEEIH